MDISIRFASVTNYNICLIICIITENDYENNYDSSQALSETCKSC